MVSTGTSLEGRDMFGLHLFGERGNKGRGKGHGRGGRWGKNDKDDDGGDEKEAIIFHGTVHAREWITSMSLEYVTYNLISEYKNGKDKAVKNILDNYDIYIVSHATLSTITTTSTWP